jgi:hypothetical protein
MHIPVDCGMITSEELEIVHCVILNPASARDCSKPEAVTLFTGQESHGGDGPTIKAADDFSRAA